MRIPIDSATSYRGRNSRPNWLLLCVSVGAALAAGALGAVFAPRPGSSAGVWYAALAKPSWSPSNAWFAPVWLVLYVLMGVAAWLIWQERYHRARNPALALYGAQLLLNAAWAPLFFGARNVGAGLFVIVALWWAIAWTMREFALVKPPAALLLVPYLAWVSFAGAVNFAIWKLNQ
jgi:benzodiazapine receptor